MSLRASYTVIAPLYDVFVEQATRGARRRSLAALESLPPGDVLVDGIGTGLDLPALPSRHRYTGIDLTRAMLLRSLPRAEGLDYRPVQGDAMALPFANARFDAAVLHLILAVVPDPARCLTEAARVLKPGAPVLVFDKFLRPGETAWLRRAANPLLRRMATRLDVVFEDVVARVPGLEVEADEPVLAGGWFRLIRLRRLQEG